MLCSQYYIQPSTLEEALEALAEQSHAGPTRLLAGGTDVMVELEHGAKPPRTIIDISRVEGLDEIRLEENRIHIGPLVT
ncbi:MAG: molybdopterin dehydrogenase, partial [Caldilineae bacterium]